MSKLLRPVLTCPACGRPDGTIFVCSQCWQKVPPKDRAHLRTMRIRGQSTDSKLEKVVRELKAKA